MSFLNLLLKGFIRSAVNQVGRDGGRVISNKIYGDRHSFPVRNVRATEQLSEINNQQIIDTEPPKLIISSNKEVKPEELKNAGYQPKTGDSSILLLFSMVLGSLVIPFLGAFYFLVKGIIYFVKKDTEYFTFVNQPVFRSDQRFKTGKRLIG